MYKAGDRVRLTGAGWGKSRGEIVEVVEDQTNPNHLTFVWSSDSNEPKNWAYAEGDWYWSNRDKT